MIEIGYEGYLSYELCHQLPVVTARRWTSRTPITMPSSRPSSCVS